MGIGRIMISEELLLRMLDFRDGEIVDTRKEWVSGSIDFVIRHPDMPETTPNERVKDVSPTYTQTDHGGVITIQRTNPPKIDRG